MLSINTNLSSLITQHSMKSATQLLNQAVERMTTGYKINHSKDNAANYSIATNMTTKINSYMVAEDNCAMGLDMLATSNGSLDQISDKLTRLRDLQTQASNGTYGSQSLNAINAEANALVDEINRLYSTAEYNGRKLFSGGNANGANGIAVASTFAMARTLSMPQTEASGFLKEIVVQDTSQFVALSSQSIDADLADGTYSITTAEELVQLATLTNAGYVSEGDIFVLGDNIDLSSSTWTAIGTTSNPFNGTIDGNGYQVILPNNDYLIEELSGNLKNIALKGSLDNRSALCCYDVNNSAIIQNVTVNNVATTNSSRDRIGIGIALNNEGLIQDSFVYFDITDTSGDIGNVTLVHYNMGTVKNCYSVADGEVRELVLENYGVLDSCYGIFNDTSNAQIFNSNTGTVTNCYITASSGNVIDSSSDWNGTKFEYTQVAPTYSSTGTGGGTTTPDVDGSTGGTGSGTSTGPSYAPDTVLLQVGTSSGWASQVGVGIKFSLDNPDELRMIGLDLTTDYLTKIDEMLTMVSEKQTEYGAAQNRLESALESIAVNIENLTSSLSTIRDADIAEVSSEYIRQQILQQASATLMATANQSPAIALQLI